MVTPVTTASHTGLPGPAGHQLGLYIRSFVSLAWKSVCFNAPSPSKRPSPRALPTTGACHSPMPISVFFSFCLFFHWESFTQTRAVLLTVDSAPEDSAGTNRSHVAGSCCIRNARSRPWKHRVLQKDPQSPPSSVPSDECPSHASLNIYSACLTKKEARKLCVNHLADTVRVWGQSLAERKERLSPSILFTENPP